MTRDEERDPRAAEPPEPPPAPAGDEEHRAGYVAIAGAPNAGKSTLLNALARAHLAAVSHKPQTTRHRTLGIVTGPGYQMILVDTPGALRPRHPLDEAMERVIHQALADADVVLYLIDAERPVHVPFVEERAGEKPTVVALNKVDRLRRREHLLPLIEDLRSRAPYRQYLPISALHQINLDRLVRTLVELLPCGLALYPPEMLTEQPERFFVAELIREQIFLLYRQEVPYESEVLIEEFREREGRKDFIQATIIVENDSQKGILIGRGGQGMRQVGVAARQAIEEVLGRAVYLELRVKTKAGWRKDPQMLRRLGYS